MRCQFLESERHNHHDDLCLIDPPVISFDGESLLNILLCDSDEFNDKINKAIVICIIPNRIDDAGVPEGAHGHLIFCVAKTKGKKKEFQSRNY